jgi:hypothetical protein
MFRIRQDQLTTLHQQALRDLEIAAIAHLRRCFSDECRLLGEEGTRDFVHEAITRAGCWELTTARAVCKFMDIMIVLSPTFDEDPHLPWVRRILSARDVSAETRAERLCQAALRLFDQFASSAIKAKAMED